MTCSCGHPFDHLTLVHRWRCNYLFCLIIAGTIEDDTSTRCKLEAHRAPPVEGAVAAGIAAVVVAVTVSGTTQTASASASTVLIKAARVAAAQPVLPALSPGQYFYQANFEQQLCLMPLSGGTGFVNYLGPDTHENWVAADGTGSVQLVADPGGYWLTPQDQERWQAAGSPSNDCDPTSGLLSVGSDAAILMLPTDPKVLGSLIAEGRVNDVGQLLATPGHCTQSATPSATAVQPGDVCSTGWQFDLVNNLLTSPVAVNKLGAVLYQILSQLPGVELIGTRTDHLGRTGIAVEDPSSGDVVVLDPSTGTLLEIQSLATTGNTLGVAPGTVVGSVTFGPVSVVNGLGILPG